MSTETITIVISSAALLLSFFGAFGWMVHRVDTKIDNLDAKLSAQISSVEERLSARIDGVAREVVEVKIAVARLEGPPRHLLTAR